MTSTATSSQSPTPTTSDGSIGSGTQGLTVEIGIVTSGLVSSFDFLNSDPWFSYRATFYTKFRPWYHEGIIGFLWILAQPTSMYSLHKIKETMETNFHPVVVVFSNCSEPHLAITGVHLHCISVRSDFGVRFTQKLYDSLRNLYVYWNIGMERQVERDPKRSEHDTFPD